MPVWKFSLQEIRVKDGTARHGLFFMRNVLKSAGWADT
jgi:hypothetical protein